MLMADLLPLVFLYKSSCRQMMVEKWKHETSKPKFRGNFKLTFLTRKYRRLPIVLDKDSTRQNNSYGITKYLP
jgi:hypothetical protein